eukprot:CAMPEP_0176457266 /NCGR_PEP_ID=MMETSP0127-20121128/31826_1 /TAXON_ID=938130 /ORGANISM="Platyophrya macrostoma, Strain WH" /LENGTH=56 /DNA_ID=CAMNT_0017847473 /DNA_START=36 /DNA_END=206 /DNA_ORIENTATION=-
MAESQDVPAVVTIKLLDSSIVLLDEIENLGGFLQKSGIFKHFYSTGIYNVFAGAEE